MYHEFYGLSERPFDLTPNTRYLYLTPMHREALAAVQHGITSRRGIIAVTGEAGTGKTTIVRAALRALRGEHVRKTYLNNPTLTRDEFLQFLSKAYRLGAEAAGSKTDLLSKLTAALGRFHAQGQIATMIVDEAQSMPQELLEEIRLLANIETSSAKLLQVVLVGQPELATRLNDPSLRQLKQRVAIRATLKPLDLRSTAALIAGRIRVAGGNPADIFTPAAVELVYRYSGGVARTINVICDNALLSGFAADQRPVRPALVEEVCRDFDLALGGFRMPSAAPRSASADQPTSVRAKPAAATAPVPRNTAPPPSVAEAVSAAAAMSAAAAGRPGPTAASDATNKGSVTALIDAAAPARDLLSTLRQRKWFSFGRKP